jgi:catechol 2,3-dioxygenase-like lactoylglutathione lyase family enzyme
MTDIYFNGAPMFKPQSAFSGFSVDNLDQAQAFYSQVLGLEVEVEKMADGQPMGLRLQLPGVARVFVYPKPNHQPATYTVLNLVVANIDLAVTELTQAGVVFEKYEGMHQDEQGITRGLAHNMGPDIAWFKDPADNILSVLQEK